MQQPTTRADTDAEMSPHKCSCLRCSASPGSVVASTAQVSFLLPATASTKQRHSRRKYKHDHRHSRMHESCGRSTIHGGHTLQQRQVCNVCSSASHRWCVPTPRTCCTSSGPCVLMATAIASNTADAMVFISRAASKNRAHDVRLLRVVCRSARAKRQWFLAAASAECFHRWKKRCRDDVNVKNVLPLRITTDKINHILLKLSVYYQVI